MKVERLVSVSCDVCSITSLTPTGTIEDSWAVVTLPMGGAQRECHVCPSCMGALLDPPDDIAGELRRFALEATL